VDVRALVFDVFGTVVDWRGGVAREARRLLGDRVDAEALADSWRGRYVPSMNRVRRGELPWTSLDELHRASLDELLGELGLPDVPAAVRAELVLAWHRLDPWPDSVAGLTRLRSRYVITSLSNGNVALLVDMAKHGGLPWDTVLSAELFGHYKPDAEVYDGAARLLGLRPEQVLMALERGPAADPPPGEDPEADLTVASLTDLATHLGT
jgi:2-haloacid dehalogenase